LDCGTNKKLDCRCRCQHPIAKPAKVLALVQCDQKYFIYGTGRQAGSGTQTNQDEERNLIVLQCVGFLSNAAAIMMEGMIKATRLKIVFLV
jgi:hypothetical protein